MIHNNFSLRIVGTGSYTPPEVVPNANISDNPKWVEENLGIFRRHVAGRDTYSSALALQAARHALECAGYGPNDIDVVIVATSTPDRQAPSTACLVQNLLGITNGCPAFDVQAVCSGFLYALTIGSQFLMSGGCRRALVIGVDTFSKITDWSSRDSVFFGDGAGAVVLEQKVSHGSRPGGFSSQLYADGRGQDNFTVHIGDETFTMNGHAVYETGTRVLPAAITNLLAANHLKISDIDHVIPHQPSIRVLRKTAEILGIPVEKIHTNMKEYANTAGATIPLLLDEVHRAGKFKNGELIVFAAVGSGWAWGAGLYRWQA